MKNIFITLTCLIFLTGCCGGTRYPAGYQFYSDEQEDQYYSDKQEDQHYSRERKNKTYNNPKYLEDGFEVIVIDSCEYIIKKDRQFYGIYCAAGNETCGYMAHKGNCRFCKERNK